MEGQTKTVGGVDYVHAKARFPWTCDGCDYYDIAKMPCKIGEAPCHEGLVLVRAQPTNNETRG